MAKAATSNLLLLTAVLLTWAGSTASVKRCPDCGTTPVPYPLSTGPDCGDQTYKIRCDASALKFDTLNNTYAIASVTADTQRFVIRPANFIPNTCVTEDLSTLGVQMNGSLPFNITSSNTILYLNCTNSILNSPLDCSVANLCHVYVNATAEAAPCRSSPICCTFRAGGSSTSYMIRLREAGCRAYRSFVHLDANLSVTRWPEPGLEIQWTSPPEPVCVAQADCDSTSTCGPDPGGNGLRRCFCNQDLHWDPIAGACAEPENVTCQDPDGCGSTDRASLIAGLAAGLGAAAVAASIGLLLYKRHRLIKEVQERLAREREEILNVGGGKSAKIFSGKEMKRATNNFSRDRILGAGGYGEVYRGVLGDGTLIAVKCAKVGNTKSTEQVLNEVRILCQVNHRGLVHLLGCCVELEQPLLVYEYIPNGALSDNLRGPNRRRLSWSDRLSIARATAEGLAYLHFSAVPPIYHRDVKSSNILLDEKLNAKVSDFGLSRLAHTDLSHISTCAQGTLGYLDPEYYRNYQLTDKSDVYSFGVVLLELLTSQKAIDFNRAADDVNLAVYVQRMVGEERMMEVVDPMLKEGASGLELETMKAVGFLAMGCLEERRQNRPSMKEVAEEIDYIISVAGAKG
ncbi:wall-associated receptor kinase-like 20 [Diospyros lotus]|uniref:wall-associated receptor kinase-like 20 n=1 Tax=Diospyros lotus TaxID=55363 RepID=UPI00225B62A0|nr:wall-associated receptor kinase-like 20 [Diospyros lotus]